MSRTILVLLLFIVIAVCAGAIFQFYRDYTNNLNASLNSPYYGNVSMVQGK
jgi:hypothetical protein